MSAVRRDGPHRLSGCDRDAMSQRRLVYELKIAIDRAIRMPQPRYMEAVLRLVDRDPHAAASTHVRYNLGVARRTWVDALLVTREEGHSLQRRSDGQEE